MAEKSSFSSRAVCLRGVVCVEKCRRRLLVGLHVKYLLELGGDESSLEALLSVHSKMGGAYWVSTALWLLGLRSARCEARLLNSLKKARGNSTAAETAEEEPLREASPNKPEEAGTSDCRGCELRREKSDERDAVSRFESGQSLNWLSQGVCKDCTFCVTALDNVLEAREERLLRWVLRCRRPCGGFASEDGHDAHVTSTHYALLILTGLGVLNRLTDPQRTAAWLRSLQTPEGAFRGDVWSEADSRSSYCAVGSLTLLGELDASVAERAVSFVRTLLNSDGGIAWVPGGESHAASAFCALATLALCQGLCAVDRHRIATWLVERQTEGGGFNGRPEKAPDVCYSFWICAAMHILGYGEWVQEDKLCDFVLAAQDDVSGGIADRPGDVADAFHTFFGLAAMGLLRATPYVEPIHPVLALPLSVVELLDLPGCTLLA